jgi:uncharacterized protein (TIGR01244 family)
MSSLSFRLRWPSLRWAFLVAILVGAGVVLASAARDRIAERVTLAHLDAHPLSSTVSVTAQLEPGQVRAVATRYGTLIDIRPDGEVAGQPSSEEMRGAAMHQGMAFVYVPVPHGDIPESAVRRLAEAMASPRGPLLLYCHSGRRAARTWALAEAERSGGLPADRILVAVHDAGQDAQDLRPRIEAAVAARGTAK